MGTRKASLEELTAATPDKGAAVTLKDLIVATTCLINDKKSALHSCCDYISLCALEVQSTDFTYRERGTRNLPMQILYLAFSRGKIK